MVVTTTVGLNKLYAERRSTTGITGQIYVACSLYFIHQRLNRPLPDMRKF